jgi:protein TonB
MDSILEGAEQLERELTPDPVAAPATGSIVLHAALFGSILAYGLINGFMHHNFWGAPGPGSAIQVTLTSSAIPLPSDQPKNDNVLPSEKPSPAPAPPEPKAKEKSRPRQKRRLSLITASNMASRLVPSFPAPPFHSPAQPISR